MRPVARLQLVLDQAVGCFGIGHAQQSFGQHHQREPLLGGEGISVQEILDTAEHAGARANRLDQTSCACVDARFGIARAACGRQQRGGDRLIRWRVRRTQRRNVARWTFCLGRRHCVEPPYRCASLP